MSLQKTYDGNHYDRDVADDNVGSCWCCFCDDVDAIWIKYDDLPRLLLVSWFPNVSVVVEGVKQEVNPTEVF